MLATSVGNAGTCPRAAREHTHRVSPSIRRFVSGVLASVVLIAMVTAVVAVLTPQTPALGLGVLYLFAVVPIALLYGAASAAAVAVASMAVFNFLFLVPRHSLNPGTAEQWEVLLAFLAASLLAGQLTARLQSEARRSGVLADEQAALRRVATLVARRVPPQEVFEAVAREVGLLLDVDATHMGRYEPDGSATGIAAWSSAGEHAPLGRRFDLDGESVTGLVYRTGRPARIRGYESAGTVSALGRELGLRSSAGAPINVDQRLWGVMVASSKGGESLPADIESKIAAFAELSATAITDAASRDGLARLLEQQAALRRVATLVASGVPPEEVFTAVIEEAGRLIPVESAALSRYEPDQTLTVLATSSAVGDRFPVGSRWPLGGSSVTTLVFETGRSARLDNYADASGPVGDAVRDVGAGAAIGAPIIVDGRLWGVVAAHSRPGQSLPADTESRLASFTELVATAIANAESRAALAASRARIVVASDETRRRIERDLHDGTQQRLVSLGLELRAAQATVPPQLIELEGKLSHVADGLVSVSDELREISRGIHPAILAEGGLPLALRALCRRSAVPVELALHVDRRLPEQVEVAAYYVVSEALTNAAKHAHPSIVNVDLDTHASTLQLAIRDDGVGGADPSQGSGLVGLGDRVAAIGGTFQITSRPGNGTTLMIDVPLKGQDGATPPEP
jgi:signal transduction histidine kinase